MKLTSPFSQDTLRVDDYRCSHRWCGISIRSLIGSRHQSTAGRCSGSTFVSHSSHRNATHLRASVMEGGKELEACQWWIYDNDEVLGFKCVTCRCYVYSHLFDMWLCFHRICSCYFVAGLIKCDGMFCTMHTHSKKICRKYAKKVINCKSIAGWDGRCDLNEMPFFPNGSSDQNPHWFFCMEERKTDKNYLKI